jgi:ketosteroid isomerase-like protein
MMTHDEVRNFLMRRIRAWETEDLDAIMADYAPDVVHITPGGRRVGTATMRENNERYIADFTGFEVALTRLILDGTQEDTQGALEWTWTEIRRSDGRRRSVDDAIVFVLRDGKIAYWREYFDTAALADG